MNKESREEKIKEEIKILMDKGFFDLKSGKVIIDKNNGLIQNIIITNTIYKRKSSQFDKFS